MPTSFLFASPEAILKFYVFSVPAINKCIRKLNIMIHDSTFESYTNKQNTLKNGEKEGINLVLRKN